MEYFKVLKVYSPSQFLNWEKKAPYEIESFFQKNINSKILIIKGFAVINYGRDIYDILKEITLLENSCRIINDNIRK